MATLAPDTPPSTPPFHQRRKSWARRVERICCTTISYLPLSFVYGLSTWAVWVEVTASLMGKSTGLNYFTAALGIILYSLAAVSYTFAVFTSPGSPLDPRRDLSKRDGTRQSGPRYEGLPTHEDDGPDFRAEAPHGPMTTVTAKSTGRKRYCKKCACLKPDRAHHCSTCGRCVLKMDHHCPWLATCVGLRNYKPFLLFLTYISLFCWISFAVSAGWVWRAIIVESALDEGLRTVNCIMLAVLSGIIGLTLSGFTAWHIYLAATGSTTIESLEKTRYLAPLRRHLEPQAQGQRHYLADDEAQTGQEQGLLEQLKETHANALPGVLRPEEGEESDSRSLSPNPASSSTNPRVPQPAQGSSPAKASLQRSYASLEEQRERDRYLAYLDEQDSEKLPNAFNLGWRRNLLHVMGDRPLLWFLPVCNTSGDGWMWEVSPKWIAARAEVARERQAREREDAVWRQEGADWERRSFQPPPPRDVRWVGGQGVVRQGGGSGHGEDGAGALPMQSLDRRKGELHPPATISATSGDGDAQEADVYHSSEEEDERALFRREGGSIKTEAATSNWNDIPEDFLASGTGSRNAQSRSHSRGRRKGD